LLDAAIELLGDHGAKGLSHLKVDRKAGVPDGTTSFYFRTSAALLYAAAERLAERDRAELATTLDLLRSNGAPASDSTASLLGTSVIASGTRPILARTRARFELALQGGRDPDLRRLVQQNRLLFIDLIRQIVMQFQRPDAEVDPALIDDQVYAIITFISGFMLSVASGDQTVDSAEEVDRFMCAIIAGLRASHEQEQAERASG
jgi:DNA-binding transcriptional regulator YbjK